MLTRREFIGAGLGAAVATHAFALPGDKMRYAMSGHQFRGMKPHPETGIKMAAQYGYHGLEPFQDDMPQYLKQPPEVFKKLLDEAGIALCTVGSGGQYLDAARVQETIESNAARAQYVSHFGCKHLKVNLSQRVGPENLSAANGKILARNLNEVGKRTMDHGHQVRVPSARVDARRAAARARHGDGADRSEVCVSRARHGTRDARRHRSREGAARLLPARRLHPPERRGSEVQHGERMARACAE